MREKTYRRRALAFTAGCLSAIVVLAFAAPVAATCPDETPLKNYTGSGSVVCPCFASGEEAGAVLQAPAEHYPIEILRVGIGWGSVYGGAPQSLEQAIKIYPAGLPNPGTAVFTLEGPALNDGYINEFNLEPLPGEIIDNSGPFTVTLKFLNANAGDPYAPSMIHDGNGCQAGKNVVYAIPGGWYSACALGVTGDWVVYAVYRRVNCEAGVDDNLITASQPSWLARPQPNPFRSETEISFFVADREQVELSVTDVRGRRVAKLASDVFDPGLHSTAWSGESADATQASPGIYFVTMDAGSIRHTQRVVLTR
jgi:hypothetical protein